MNILLMGLRGSGKTTVGRLLARNLNQPFVDLDEAALTRFPEETVRDVWDQHGEAAWRQAEAAALQQVLESDGQVIALGGGTPMIHEAGDAIRAARRQGAAIAIYLRCDVDELCRRLTHAPGDRPKLTALDLRAEIAHTIARREATYHELADVTCDVAGKSASDVAAELAAFVLHRDRGPH